MLLAKNINLRVNSSVHYNSIANTVDSSKLASTADVGKSLLGCGEHGGMLGVKVNTSNPAIALQSTLPARRSQMDI